MLTRKLFAIMLLAIPCVADESSASEIMAKVAANQDRAVALRQSYVFQQHVVVATRHFNGKLAREENANYDVLPSVKSVQRKLEKIFGRYESKGHVIAFDGEAIPQADSLKITASNCKAASR